MPDDRPKSTENMLKEVLAKQDLLLASIQELRTELVSVKSEMRSNYVAYAAMFQEIVAAPKV
jgi:hypothetical protein